ncbi:hypothetical protein DR_1064 [Deinococcus radiodurans R1 = ATCC 13939 = DSM 20539]|uniref:Serine aminopeptidase S33 domain-containing protein n=1 Tax=Deinococcus radiodurans (strain ATCC 13939 / DSM 20539 / JCM 16871 / CCUG 27074 / LMG 4051 / NBRC 15346 / NCIMB 9279 / VKM B-1422 / R1) TaxID=243230 RepID=Q9RVG5_DEIRA|nr:hypothetical protein DR_1064 [Deinococcus radiodurans R1 = ATCC 13939 = DSM 20539]
MNTTDHATPLTEGHPYRVERAVLAGVPCLLELPPKDSDVRGVCLVYHGAWAAKEGKLGVYSALTTHGIAVVIPDAALHGERQGDTPPGLNAREYVWDSVRRTVVEAPALLDALAGRFGAGPVLAVGSSMGGYVVQTLLQTEPRLTRARCAHHLGCLAGTAGAGAGAAGVSGSAPAPDPRLARGPHATADRERGGRPGVFARRAPSADGGGLPRSLRGRDGRFRGTEFSRRRPLHQRGPARRGAGVLVGEIGCWRNRLLRE